MARRASVSPGGRPWVDSVARYISDPVARLRFLKAVAPVLPDAPRRSRPLRWLFIGLLAVPLLLGFALLRTPVRARSPRHLPPARAIEVPPPRRGDEVWPVERRGETETYSNGLRVENRFATVTHARSYLAFPASGRHPAERRSRPAGIVFHATESQQAPFEARENGVLKRIGESLLEYVRRRRSYNFLIDRFGRVYRVVPEEQAANHAGYSVWADDQWTYLNLNESFLGVSFEAETRRPEISPAQVRSAAMLIEMLRSRYGIPAASCVTHAQVSVNPANMRVGYHVDWAAGFPFQALGLPDNYGTALPALWQFGFDSDAAYRAAAGSLLRTAIAQSESRFTEDAAGGGLTPASYRKLLRRRYHDLLADMRRKGTGEGVEPE